MEYRRATIQDLDTLVGMRIEFLQDMHPSHAEADLSVPVSRLPEYFRRHLGRDFFAYLAVEDGRAVSSVYLVISERPANLHISTGRFGVILNVYTKPGFRRRGLATALLKLAMADAEKQHMSYVELQATKSGKPVYEKLGFKAKEPVYTCMEYRCGAPDDSSAGKS